MIKMSHLKEYELKKEYIYFSHTHTHTFLRAPHINIISENYLLATASI